MNTNQALASRGRAVFEATRTPLERMKLQLKDMDALFLKGAVTFDTYQRGVKMIKDEFAQATGIGRGFFQSTLGIAFKWVGALMAVQAAMKAVTVGVTAATRTENAQVVFAKRFQSPEKAQGFIQDLQSFAVESPFTFQHLLRGSQRMMALGFDAEEVLPILTDLTDIMAASPTGLDDAMDGVTLALGQMRGKGRVMAQEMNQLTERGVPAWEALVKATGKSQGELMKSMEVGRGPTAEVAIRAIRDLAKDPRYKGLGRDLTKTTSGAWSKFVDSAEIGLGKTFTKLFDAIHVKDLIPALGDGLKVVLDTLNPILDTGKELLGVFTDLFGGAFDAGTEVLGGAFRIAGEIFRRAAESIRALRDSYKAIAELASGATDNGNGTFTVTDPVLGRKATIRNDMNVYRDSFGGGMRVVRESAHVLGPDPAVDLEERTARYTDFHNTLKDQLATHGLSDRFKALRQLNTEFGLGKVGLSHATRDVNAYFDQMERIDDLVKPLETVGNLFDQLGAQRRRIGEARDSGLFGSDQALARIRAQALEADAFLNFRRQRQAFAAQVTRDNASPLEQFKATMENLQSQVFEGDPTMHISDTVFGRAGLRAMDELEKGLGLPDKDLRFKAPLAEFGSQEAHAAIVRHQFGADRQSPQERMVHLMELAREHQKKMEELARQTAEALKGLKLQPVKMGN